MEMGGPHDEMVFGSFDLLEKELLSLSVTIKERGMMTPEEESTINQMHRKIANFPDVEKKRRFALEKKIADLAETYPTRFNP